MNPLNENEYVEVENRLYSNPQTSLNESLNFIDNLRASQGQQNQEIVQQTQNLGTNINSNLGGLVGGEGYFTSRYQTPQSISAIANLRATAQAAALNEALANEQAMWKKRYQDAYRNYQKSQYDKTYGGGGGDGTTETKLPIDVNSGDMSSGDVSLNTNTGAGVYIPVTNFVGDYLSDDGSQWWQLGSIRQSDIIPTEKYGIGSIPNGSIVEGSNGITFMYLQNEQFPNGRWFRATRSAGPGTYSPYAGVNNEQ